MKSAFEPSKLQTPVTVFYNGSHAASAVEIDFLNKKNNGSLELVEIDGAADRAKSAGIDAAAVADTVYAVDAAGTVLSGVDALYMAHEAVGLGNYFQMGRMPGFSCEGTGIGPQG